MEGKKRGKEAGRKITNRSTAKFTNMWKLNNTLSTNGSKKKSQEIRRYREMNEKENTTHQHLWDAVKAVLGGKFMVLPCLH